MRFLTRMFLTFSESEIAANAILQFRALCLLASALRADACKHLRRDWMHLILRKDLGDPFHDLPGDAGPCEFDCWLIMLDLRGGS